MFRNDINALRRLGLKNFLSVFVLRKNRRFSEKFRLSKKMKNFHSEDHSKAFGAIKKAERIEKKEKSKTVSQVYESFWQEPGWRFTASLQIRKLCELVLVSGAKRISVI